MHNLDTDPDEISLRGLYSDIAFSSIRQEKKKEIKYTHKDMQQYYLSAKKVNKKMREFCKKTLNARMTVMWLSNHKQFTEPLTQKQKNILNVKEWL